jgi:hypothetical protein
MTRFPHVLACALGLLTAAEPAVAQQQARCAPRAQLLELIENRFAETRRAIGLTASQTVMELYASENSGSWTILVTLPNGMTCLVAAGSGFEAETGPAPARGAPT